ncbi:MAG: CCA tRNA nucleotidyltransferase [Candidatus Moranbacteria bacterium]|nr:CCA tRNA nucleotidyltransferase [Candidatus Moranbacteria bacterium]
MKKEKLAKFDIPAHILLVMEKLEEAGFEAYVVGGCVRDLLMGLIPKDWDIATNAKPEDVQKIFPDSVYENEFGTVGIKIRNQKSVNSEQETEEKEITEVVEVTTYRIESTYSDKRHPDAVKFAKTLEEDLSRRDFTINALALGVSDQKSLPTGRQAVNSKQKKIEKIDGTKFELIDLFSGQEDLENKLIRAVGDANERFNEDALRMMRAIRFSVTLDFVIEEKTFVAIQKNASNLKFISPERIRDEFSKIISSPSPAKGIERLQETGILKIILPEIESGIGVMQSHHHYHGPYNTVYKHLVASLEKCPSPKLEVRLASLLHDVGKPKSKRGEGENATFYNHEYIGERMTKNILERLRFSRSVIDKVTLLVRNHMFYYNVDEVGEAGVRRVVQKIGLENIGDLIDVRIADRLGSGVPKAVPYKLRHFQFMVEKVSHDAISVKQLKLNGNDLMEELNVAPGPKIGAILAVLLSQVIDDPALNDKKKLLALAKELAKSKVEDLRKMAEEKIKKEQKKEEELIKKKHKVS